MSNRTLERLGLARGQLSHTLDGPNAQGPRLEVYSPMSPLNLQIGSINVKAWIPSADIAHDAIFGQDFLTRFGHELNLPLPTSATVASLSSDATPTIDQYDIDADDFTFLEQPASTEDLRVPSWMASTIQSFPSLWIPPTTTVDRAIVHEIHLKPDTLPRRFPPRRLTPVQYAELDKQLKDLLDKGLIRRSTSSWASPVTFARKHDGGWRLCIDYRHLNECTIKDSTPLPRIDDNLDAMHGAKYFDKYDLRWGYWQVPLKEEHKHLTAFTTRQGLFEWNVMPFGLCNAPATFTRLMMSCFAPHDVLDKYLVHYIDDLVVYSKSKEEHIQNVSKILSILADNHFTLNAKKCAFGAKQIEYCGFTISQHGLHPSTSKVSLIVDWPVPETRKHLASALGLFSFYRRFIKDYSKIASPLTDLVVPSRNPHENLTKIWTTTHDITFNALKQAVTSTPVLLLPDPAKPYRLIVDWSKLAIGGVLEQPDDTSHWHPVAYGSHKNSQAQSNYSPTDGEFFAIMFFLRYWRHLVQADSTRHITIVSDHDALKWLNTQPDLSSRQIRWKEELTTYPPLTFTIRPGNGMGAADTLSRRWWDTNSLGTIASLQAMTFSEDSSLKQMILDSYQDPTDPWFHDIYKQLSDPSSVSSLKPYSTMRHYKLVDGFLVHVTLGDDRICIPKNAALHRRILELCHDHPLVGHPGVNKTLSNVRKQFYWHNLDKYVRNYVDHCPRCNLAKPSNKSAAGHFKGPDAPLQPWDVVSMDFNTDFPTSAHGNDMIWTIVDVLSKRVRLFAVSKSISAKGCVEVFFTRYFPLHGIPKTIYHDRDVRWADTFWQELLEKLGARLSTSTADHHETAGQAERMNRTIGQYLRLYASDHQSTWESFLPLMEFAINSTVSDSTKMTPFMLDGGYERNSPLAIGQTVNLDTRTFPVFDADNADNFVHYIKNIIAEGRESFTLAQQRNLEYRNAGRPPLTFQVGDLVKLNTSSIDTRLVDGDNAARKLRDKWIGPFKVIAAMHHNAYKLQLPPEFRRLHPVFDVSKLHLFKSASHREHLFGTEPVTSMPEPVQELSEPAFSGGRKDEAPRLTRSTKVTSNTTVSAHPQVPPPPLNNHSQSLDTLPAEPSFRVKEILAVQKTRGSTKSSTYCEYLAQFEDEATPRWLVPAEMQSNHIKKLVTAFNKRCQEDAAFKQQAGELGTQYRASLLQNQEPLSVSKRQPRRHL